jgi:hypothetical protein
VLFPSDEIILNGALSRMNGKDMRVLRLWALPLAVLSAAWIVSVPLANAQAQTPNAQAPNAPTQAQPSNIPDQKLDATAAAVVQVSTIQQNYQQKLTSAPPGEKERIAKQANDAMARAVTDRGLSIEEYNSILEVAQNDPQIRQKILQRIKTK